MALPNNYFEKLALNSDLLAMFQELDVDINTELINKIKKLEITNFMNKEELEKIITENGKDLNSIIALLISNLGVKKRNELKKIYNQLAKDDIRQYKKVYEYTGKEYKLRKKQYEIINNAIKMTDNDLKKATKNLSNIVQQTYVDLVNNMFEEVVKGKKDIATAFKNTTTKLFENNISVKDKNNRNRSIEASVRQNILYRTRECVRDINKELGIYLGCNGIQINITPNCRPDHIVINGQIFSDKEWKKYKHLLDDYGCQHYEEPIIMDIEENKYSQEEIDEANNRTVKYKGEEIPYYEATQKQRYYERQVRNAKKEYAIAKKSGLDVSIANQHIKKAQTNLDKYCKDTGLERDRDREYFGGYNSRKK